MTHATPEHLLHHADALIEEARTTRQRAFALLEERHGLVPGVTRVREGDLEGIFLESLNYRDGRLWIKVRLAPPLPGRFGTYRHFYGDWKVVHA